MLAAPFGRLCPGLLPQLMEAAWCRSRTEAASLHADAPSSHLAVLSTLSAGLSTRTAVPGVASVLSSRSGDCAGNTRLASLISLAASADTPLPLRLEALAALRGAGRNYAATVAGAWGDASSGLVVALHACLSSPDDKLASAAARCLYDTLRSAGGLDLETSGQSNSSDDAALLMPAPKQPLTPPAHPPVDLPHLVAMWCSAATALLPLACGHTSAAVRSCGAELVTGLSPACAAALPTDVALSLLALPQDLAASDAAPSVRAAACRSLGVCAPWAHSHEPAILSIWAQLLVRACDAAPPPPAGIVLAAACALADVCCAVRHATASAEAPLLSGAAADVVAACVTRLCHPSSRAAEKARGHGARCLGHSCAVHGLWTASDHAAARLTDAAAALTACLTPGQLGSCPKMALSACVAAEPLLRALEAASPPDARTTCDALLHALAAAMCAPGDALPVRVRTYAALACCAPEADTAGAYGAALPACLDACCRLLARHDLMDGDVGSAQSQALVCAATSALARALVASTGDAAAVVPPTCVAPCCAALTDVALVLQQAHGRERVVDGEAGTLEQRTQSMALGAAMRRCGAVSALRVTPSQVCAAGAVLAELAGSCAGGAPCEAERAALVAACDALRRALTRD